MQWLGFFVCELWSMIFYHAEAKIQQSNYIFAQFGIAYLVTQQVEKIFSHRTIKTTSEVNWDGKTTRWADSASVNVDTFEEFRKSHSPSQRSNRGQYVYTHVVMCPTEKVISLYSQTSVHVYYRAIRISTHPVEKSRNQVFWTVTKNRVSPLDKRKCFWLPNDPNRLQSLNYIFRTVIISAGKALENGSISARWHHTACAWSGRRKAKVQLWTDDGWKGALGPISKPQSFFHILTSVWGLQKLVYWVFDSAFPRVQHQETFCLHPCAS